MGPNRVFFPQRALDQWLSSGEIELSDNELFMKNEGRRYRLVEAVRIMAEVSGADDPFELAGRVKTVAYVTELGAELLDTSMIIGENAYDVIPGWVGAPIPRSSGEYAVDGAEAESDEQLLAQFLMRNL